MVFGGEYPDVDDLNIYEGGHCYSDLYHDFSEAYHVFALEWEEDVFRCFSLLGEDEIRTVQSTSDEISLVFIFFQSLDYS